MSVCVCACVCVCVCVRARACVRALSKQAETGVPRKQHPKESPKWNLTLNAKHMHPSTLRLYLKGNPKQNPKHNPTGHPTQHLVVWFGFLAIPEPGSVNAAKAHSPPTPRAGLCLGAPTGA